MAQVLTLLYQEAITNNHIAAARGKRGPGGDSVDPRKGDSELIFCLS